VQGKIFDQMPELCISFVPSIPTVYTTEGF